MSDKTRWAIAIGLFTASMAFGIWYGMAIWDECREAGHSVMYCMRMVTR